MNLKLGLFCPVCFRPRVIAFNKILLLGFYWVFVFPLILLLLPSFYSLIYLQFIKTLCLLSITYKLVFPMTCEYLIRRTSESTPFCGCTPHLIDGMGFEYFGTVDLPFMCLYLCREFDSTSMVRANNQSGKFHPVQVFVLEL